MPLSDIRQKVLGGSVKLKSEAVWVERWEEWVEVRELMGDERAALMKANINQKTGIVNITTFYPHLAIISTRYPSVDCEPADLEVPILDANGEPMLNGHGSLVKLVKPPHLDKFPSKEERQKDPKAGELVFQITDRDSLNQTSGAALEQLGQVAARLSGLLPEQLQEKKGN